MYPRFLLTVTHPEVERDPYHRPTKASQRFNVAHRGQHQPRAVLPSALGGEESTEAAPRGRDSPLPYAHPSQVIGTFAR